MKVEYRVREVTRFIVTRYEETENTGRSEVCGQFDTESDAGKARDALAAQDWMARNQHSSEDQQRAERREFITRSTR